MRSGLLQLYGPGRVVYFTFPLIYVTKSGTVIDLTVNCYEVSKLLIFFAYCLRFFVSAMRNL